VTEASTSLMESQALLSETQTSFEQVKANVDELNAKFEEVNSKCTTLEAENNSIQEKYQAVKAERNTLKQKNESLAKDMARIRKTGMEISDIERIIQENSDLHAQVELLRAQQSHLVGDLEHAPSKEEEMENSNDDSGESSGPSAEELRRAWEQKTELERMVKELTEYVNAKQSQLDTMKDVNRQLTEELQNVARSRRAPLKPFFDKDAKASADTDKNLKLMQGQNNTEALTKVIEERDSLKTELVSKYVMKRYLRFTLERTNPF
jgi:chromosome segregation ATPase